MNIVRVHYPDGAEEIAFLLETVNEPTVRLLDADGREFVTLQNCCALATPEEVKSYWSTRMRRSKTTAIDTQIELARKSLN